MRKQTAAIIALLLPAFPVDLDAQSAVYACGHIRRERTTAIDNLKNSGYTTAILFNVSVERDGTLTTDFNWDTQTAAEAGGIVCQDGEYVFDQWQPHYADDVHRLVAPPTSVGRLEICIGGWGNGSYGHIRDCIAAHGTDARTMLYRNFKALKEALPDVVAVNNDQERDFDADVAVKFHKMLAEIGFKTTITPYAGVDYWRDIVAQLNADSVVCERVYLQTYAGGDGNQPEDWDVFGGIPLYIGFDCEASDDIESMQTKFEQWRDRGGVAGGFLWNYNSEARDINQWAATVNRIFAAKTTDSPVATFYQHPDYGGYAVGLPLGEFTQSELALYGIQARDISSFQLADGYKVTLYSGHALDGASSEWDKSTDRMEDEWDDLACSLKIETTQAGTATAKACAHKLTATFENDRVVVWGAAAGRVALFNSEGKMLDATMASTNGHTRFAPRAHAKGSYIVKATNGTAKLTKH